MKKAITLMMLVASLFIFASCGKEESPVDKIKEGAEELKEDVKEAADDAKE
jgi:predicted small lipoprotein YifL